jgi:hypothetical protein
MSNRPYSAMYLAAGATCCTPLAVAGSDRRHEAMLLYTVQLPLLWKYLEPSRDLSSQRAVVGLARSMSTVLEDSCAAAAAAASTRVSVW